MSEANEAQSSELNSRNQDDVSSSEEEDIEASIKVHTQNLEADPYSFTSYAELIRLHRESGDLDQTWAYRQRVQSIYSLPEEMWLDWLHDEISVANGP